MKKSGMKMMGAVRGIAKLGNKPARKRKPAAAGSKKLRKSRNTNLGAIGGPLTMKKSAAKKMVDTNKLKPGAKKLVEGVASKNTVAKMKKAAMKLKQEEKSVMTMKKAAMKLKKDSAAMMKKAAMKMKKVSAMKMKMKKK